MKKYIILLLALCSMSACDYEAVNTNPYGVSDGELGPLKYGARFMNMQQRVIPIGSPSLTTGPGNDLQNTDLISSGNYIGYFGNNNNWGFNNITPVMAYPNLNMGKLINPKRYNYYIEDHNELSLHINDLLHTRMYDSDKFSLIFTSCGEFEIGYSVMCEEWEEPVKGNFQINVEYK